MHLDDSKHYFVIEAPEYDRHGMSFDSLEGYVKEKHEALVNVMYVAMSIHRSGNEWNIGADIVLF